MKIISGVASGISRLARLDIELSKEARHRLKWFDYYDSHGHNARLTCRHFDVSPQTFYRWKKRYNRHHLKSLESHSCRPRKVRQPTYSPELILAVQQVREEYCRWGKDKLAILLHRKGFACSTSTVGRIITRLKVRGVLKEIVRNHVSAHRKGMLRSYGTRKPQGYRINEPGDLVQLDTLDLRPLPGVVLKHFTARDMVSRWDVMNVYHRATAATACHFLDELEMRMPFPIRAVQVDGGAEFEAEFEQQCQRRSIRLFILPPRSPELNGCVERAHRTHTEEFYEVTESSFELAELRTELMHWEATYNTIRPHQALGYLTPYEFIKQRQQKSGREVMCH